jgi:hypothetical protein
LTKRAKEGSETISERIRFSGLVIEKHHGPGASAAKNDAEVVTRSVRANGQEGFLNPRPGIRIFQVALQVVPGTRERPDSKVFETSDTDAPKSQIAHREEAHHDAFFLAMVGVQKEGVRVGMATVMLQEKASVIGWQLVANIGLEGRDLRVRRRTGWERMSDLGHGDLGRIGATSANATVQPPRRS